MRTNYASPVLAALLGALVAQSASASELFTSILNIETANPGSPLSALRCQVVNVSSAPRNGTLQIIGGNGAALSFGAFNGVAPGGATGIAATTFTGPAITTAYCKVTVEGGKNTIRASLALTDADGNTIANAEAR